MDELERLGRRLAIEQSRTRELYRRTREAEQTKERIESFLKKLPCPNKYCENGELWAWKWNSKSTRRKYKIGICKFCDGEATAAAAFAKKEKLRSE